MADGSLGRIIFLDIRNAWSILDSWLKIHEIEKSNFVVALTLPIAEAGEWPLVTVPTPHRTPKYSLMLNSKLLELLGQLKALSLIVRLDVLPVQEVGPSGHTLIAKPADRLSMLQQEGYLV